MYLCRDRSVFGKIPLLSIHKRRSYRYREVSFFCECKVVFIVIGKVVVKHLTLLGWHTRSSFKSAENKVLYCVERRDMLFGQAANFLEFIFELVGEGFIAVLFYIESAAFFWTGLRKCTDH